MPRKSSKRRPEPGSNGAKVAVDAYRELKAEHGRSRVANDSSLFLSQVDGRTAAVRRFKEIYLQICEDLGGKDHLSEAQRQIARRAATLSAILESMEALWVTEDAAFNRLEYQTLSNAMLRLYNTLGLQRRPRDITNIHDYIDELAKQEADEHAQHQ